MVILILSVFVTVSVSLASEEHKWPWNPNKDELDIGEHATFTEVLGAHNHSLQILIDAQHKYMAIKDLHFNGCYLVDVPTLHMPVDEMILRIKKMGVAVLPGEFDVKYPNIPHTDVHQKFGHRIAHLCRHNPTMWLIKHERKMHSSPDIFSTINLPHLEIK